MNKLLILLTTGLISLNGLANEHLCTEKSVILHSSTNIVEMPNQKGQWYLGGKEVINVSTNRYPIKLSKNCFKLVKVRTNIVDLKGNKVTRNFYKLVDKKENIIQVENRSRIKNVQKVAKNYTKVKK